MPTFTGQYVLGPNTEQPRHKENIVELAKRYGCDQDNHLGGKVPLVYMRETIKTVTTAVQRGLPIKEYLTATVVRTLMTCFTERQMLYLHGPTSQTYQTWIEKEAKIRNLSPVQDTVVLADGTTRLHWIKKTKDKASKVVLLFHGGGYYVPIAPGHLN
ncbi:alpha/beta-hydrolase, partial [Aureobasidium melanogenum]